MPVQHAGPGRRTHCSGILLLLLLAPVAPVRADPTVESDLPALLESYRSPHLATCETGFHDRISRVGNMEFTFESGVLCTFQGPRGDVLGLFFEGKGTYTYRSVDPADRQVVEGNLSRLRKSSLYNRFAVSDTFKRLLLFFAAPEFEDLWTSEPPRGTSADSAPGPARESAFEQTWKRIGQTYLEHDHLAAEARLNGGGRRYVYAEIEGSRETVGYTFDHVRAFEERLFLFRKVQGIDVRFLETVSVQPLDAGSDNHPPMVMLKDARIEIRTDDNRSASINSDLTLEAREDGLRVVRLLLMNNRDPRHYDWRSPKNALRIRRLAGEGGAELPYSHRYNEVLVLLPTPLQRGQLLRLRFETAGEVLTDLHGGRQDNYFNLFLDPWFPRPDRWTSRGTPFSLKIRTRKPFVPVASGGTRSLRESGDYFELETTSSRPASLIAVFAGKYITREGTFGDTVIRVHAYAAAREDLLDRMPRVANMFLRFYEKSLGPYPFGDLDIVEAPDFLHEGSGGIGWGGFGFSPSGLILVSSNAFNPRKFVPTLEAYKQAYGDASTWDVSRGMNQVLAHEIAHQWFPHKAMPVSPRDSWLSESLAEYVSGLAIAAANPDRSDVKGFPTLFAEWRFQARSCKDGGSIETATMLSGPDAPRNYFCLLYDRGPLVLHMLRAMSGDERFFAILRLYLDRANMGTVTTDDFRKAAEEVLQTDLGWFFEDWYGKDGIPDVRIAYAVRESAAGAFSLTGRAEQTAGASFRRVLIPLVLDYGGEDREVRLVFQDQPIEEFSFSLKKRPKKIVVDPFQNNLVTYR